MVLRANATAVPYGVDTAVCLGLRHRCFGAQGLVFSHGQRVYFLCYNCTDISGDYSDGVAILSVAIKDAAALSRISLCLWLRRLV